MTTSTTELSSDCPRRDRPHHFYCCGGASAAAWDDPERATPLLNYEPGPAQVEPLKWPTVIDIATYRPNEDLLLRAADRLSGIDVELARDMYLEALGTAVSFGHGNPDRQPSAVARAALRAPTMPRPLRPVDLLLNGLISRFTEGHTASVPELWRALRAYAQVDVTAESGRWRWLAFRIATDLWDDDALDRLLGAPTNRRAVDPEATVSPFPVALSSPGGISAAMSGVTSEGCASRLVIQELDGQSGAECQPSLRAYRAETGIDLSLLDGTGGDGPHPSYLADYGRAVNANALGNYESAVAAAQRICQQDNLGLLGWALAELVEGAIRARHHGLATEALGRLLEMTRASSTDWALGIEARAAALASEGPTAEALYRESIERLNDARIDVHRARSQLLYGEWLRRENRRLDARGQLRSAHQEFEAMGAQAFAARAGRELLATGETVRKRTPSSYRDLTAQEKQIAQLAGSRLTNSEIAMQLYISPRTVEWHLRKVFAKCGVTSRRELGALSHQS
jgi:DNA-binding CsgD family transcriptional regulator